MKVHWIDNAVDHLANIFEYIALNSPTYARRMVDRITRRSEQIGDIKSKSPLEYNVDWAFLSSIPKIG